MRRLGWAVLFLFWWTALAGAQRVGVPVVISWNATAPPDPGVTVDGFQVQACTATSCTVPCAPTDMAGGNVGSSILTFTDVNVVGGWSYWYQVVTTGTINGAAARSVPTPALCQYVRAQRRGPVIFPPNQ